MWMAYQATKDPLYLRSLRAIISHMSYSQWDNIGDPRAFGGGDEGTNIPCDVINGFGAPFPELCCSFFSNADHGARQGRASGRRRAARGLRCSR